MREREPETFEEEVRREAARNVAEKVISSGMTRKTHLPGREERREPMVRFERGEIFRAYQAIRQQIHAAEKRGESIQDKKEHLRSFRGRAREWEKNLDILNRQYHENIRPVTIEEPDVGTFSLPAIELDIQKPPEGQEDTRIPWVLIGGQAWDSREKGTLAFALALSGKRVFTLTYPEKGIDAAGRKKFAQHLREDGTYQPHAQIFKRSTEQLGLEKFNIVGFSMGGGISLEMARDRSFNKRINDLVVIEPVGLEEKSFARIAREFMFHQLALRTLPDAEARLKTIWQYAPGTKVDPQLLRADTDILRKRQFDRDALVDVAPAGRYQVWVGTESPISGTREVGDAVLGAETARLEKHRGAAPVEVHFIQGGDHTWPLVHALGFVQALDKERGKERISTTEKSSLDHSAAEILFRDSKESTARP